MEELIPGDICEEAKDYLKSVITALRENDLLTSLDYGAIEALGYTYHFWFQARQEILRDGCSFKGSRGDIKPHPAVKQENDKLIQLTKIWETLGLTPKARKEINKSKDKTERERQSPLEKFIVGTVERR